MKPNASAIGIGPTDKLSLRVSVAVLVRVLFEHPDNGEQMLSLECRATLFEDETGPTARVLSQPFGGAIRIYDPVALQSGIGDFHFDSERSRTEQDFRLFICPSDWGVVQRFCLEQFNSADEGILESGPGRELAEEFLDTSNLKLRPDQYVCKPAGIVLENVPSQTDNHAASGYPTVRIYRIFEAGIRDASLSRALLRSSGKHSALELSQRARENGRTGGPGRANTVLTLPFTPLHQFYLTLSPELLNSPVSFQNHRLDETVAAVFDDIMIEKYQKR